MASRSFMFVVHRKPQARTLPARQGDEHRLPSALRRATLFPHEQWPVRRVGPRASIRQQAGGCGRLRLPRPRLAEPSDTVLKPN